MASVDGDISFYELSAVAATSASLRGVICGAELQYSIPHCVSYSMSRDDREVRGLRMVVFAHAVAPRHLFAAGCIRWRRPGLRDSAHFPDKIMAHLQWQAAGRVPRPPGVAGRGAADVEGA